MPRLILLLAAALPFLAAAQTDYVNIPAPERSKDPYLRTPGDYSPNPHSLPNPNIPHGRIQKFEWNDSRLFPGTTRSFWLYIPAQYEANTPAPFMIFQDGWSFLREEGTLRANNVMDSLIHKGLMPPTIAVFINPGQRPPRADEGKAPPNPNLPLNRRFEYDNVTETYPRFLLEEIIPTIKRHVNLSDNPADWAIVGNSSGATAAFNAAWRHPEVFGKVILHNSSFVDLLGGDVIIDWVQNEAAKPLRISVTSSPFDLDNQYGSWWDANRKFAAALADKGYDHRAFWGDAAHNPTFAGATLSNTLRWIWRDHPIVLAHTPQARSPEETVFIQIPAQSKPATYNKKPTPYERIPDTYPPHPDTAKQDGTPQGTLIPYQLNPSSVYPNTTRDAWLYVPSQYNKSKPAALAVFMDGRWFCSENSPFQTQTVFDNLIASGDMPVALALFINPGDFPKEKKPFPSPISPRDKQPSNRRVEYDAIDDRFARFLIEEVIPQLRGDYAISDSPKDRLLVGNSSGGSCAFNAVWHRPDQFGNVVSHIGSFTAIRGAHHYPQIVRDSEPRPIRVFLQSGVNDQISVFGNWWQANLDLANELEAKRYDLKTVWGDGAHNAKHPAAIFPDTLRWIFRDHAE
ncbi:alpha/beta hydrolase [Pelagicoccus mobilis]|uniref:Esterase n=1 Tax=Pelagicoccus mobilis TaxID=415221 RepID=A0A934VMT7_9BACT|nr:alpha/beta hydrolase-fold protein [Pelagicoccus mobilis]MBK1879186.1 hypothetical protein [Pelagicoccus mobilis]